MDFQICATIICKLFSTYINECVLRVPHLHAVGPPLPCSCVAVQGGVNCRVMVATWRKMLAPCSRKAVSNACHVRVPQSHTCLINIKYIISPSGIFLVQFISKFINKIDVMQWLIGAGWYAVGVSVGEAIPRSLSVGIFSLTESFDTAIITEG